MTDESWVRDREVHQEHVEPGHVALIYSAETQDIEVWVTNIGKDKCDSKEDIRVANYTVIEVLLASSKLGGDAKYHEEVESITDNVG